jgi:serine protease Do
MPLYDLPKIKLPKMKIPKIKTPKFWRSHVFLVVVLSIVISSFFGFISGIISGNYFFSEIKESLSKLNIEIPEPQVIEKIVEKEYQPQTTQEEKIIRVVENVSPTVVSIVVTKDVPVFEQYYTGPFEEFEEFFGEFFELQIPEYRQEGTEKKEIGWGTGFIVSKEGMILTNRHVVLEEEVDYTVLTNDGQKFPAQVLARDPLRDLAVIKIEGQKSFPVAKFGDSDTLQIGQTVIAIGNALGEFRNTVSVGVISGLGRTVTASGGGIIETLEDVIQTDAAINKGNSGGPLLNLKGEVIGVNFAIAQAAENIGFAIPINKGKKDIEQVKTLGKIVYPYLGVYYCLIDEEVQKEYNLSVGYGAWVGRDKYCQPYEKSVIEGTAAEAAGLKEGDIILEFDGKTITTENSLAKIIMEYDPGDKVVLKILREGEEKIVQVTLGEMSQ